MATAQKSGLLIDAVTVNSADLASGFIVNSSRNGLTSFHARINNTNLVGTLRIQGNNDPDNANLNWVDLLTATISSGTDIDDIYDLVPTASKYLRALVDYTSGSGVVTVVAHSLVG